MARQSRRPNPAERVAELREELQEEREAREELEDELELLRGRMARIGGLATVAAAEDFDDEDEEFDEDGEE